MPATSEQYNRAIAEACGWTDIYEEEWFENYSNLFGTRPGSIRPMPLPDYYYSIDEAIEAAAELLNYGLCIFLDPNDPHITYKNGKRDEFGDLWTRLSTRSNAPADIAAAICEAIVQACGIVVESEVSDGQDV